MRYRRCHVGKAADNPVYSEASHCFLPLETRIWQDEDLRFKLQCSRKCRCNRTYLMPMDKQIHSHHKQFVVNSVFTDGNLEVHFVQKPSDTLGTITGIKQDLKDMCKHFGQLFIVLNQHKMHSDMSMCKPCRKGMSLSVLGLIRSMGGQTLTIWEL